MQHNDQLWFKTPQTSKTETNWFNKNNFIKATTALKTIRFIYLLRFDLMKRKECQLLKINILVYRAKLEKGKRFPFSLSAEELR